jgi:hypothetical protein
LCSEDGASAYYKSGVLENRQNQSNNNSCFVGGGSCYISKDVQMDFKAGNGGNPNMPNHQGFQFGTNVYFSNR